eukprot:TRINITY_DN11591_c0_g2_i1.p1 TRINITY_DN11591_c0_g2~~TRINITY_DN11591_c0_g2_i1.p1  ORF type:complete len:699 (-),score=147.12 TRINITY_DN11591_c0_g2_i1:232-2328(-)
MDATSESSSAQRLAMAAEGSGSRVSELLSTRHSNIIFEDDYLRRKAELDKVASHEDEHRILGNVWFKRVIVGVIIINSLQLGLCAQPDDRFNTSCDVAEISFTGVYLVEMVLKLYALRFMYFRDVWNDLDFVLVWMGIVDLIVEFFFASASEDLENAAILRILRLLRAARLVRVLRTRRELVVLFEGLIASLKAMVWVAFLLLVIVYAGAIFCVGAFSDVRWDNQEWKHTYFENVFWAMVTLFNMSIVAEWQEIFRPVIDQYNFLAMFFVVFIFISSFGILNLIIGIITESTTKAAIDFEKRADLEFKVARMDLIETSAQRMFEPYIAVGDGTMTHRDMSTSDPECFRELLEGVDLPDSFTFADMHLMISGGKSGIHKDEFITGMRRILFRTEFQRDCVFQHSINELKLGMKSLFNEVKALRTALRGDILALLSTSPGRGAGGCCAKCCSSCSDATGNGQEKEVKVSRPPEPTALPPEAFSDFAVTLRDFGAQLSDLKNSVVQALHDDRAHRAQEAVAAAANASRAAQSAQAAPVAAPTLPQSPAYSFGPGDIAPRNGVTLPAGAAAASAPQAGHVTVPPSKVSSQSGGATWLLDSWGGSSERVDNEGSHGKPTSLVPEINLQRRQHNEIAPDQVSLTTAATVNGAERPGGDAPSEGSTPSRPDDFGSIRRILAHEAKTWGPQRSAARFNTDTETKMV